MTQTIDPGRRLAGRTAIVTGAGTGIGQGIAVAMAKQGANIVIVQNGSRVEESSGDYGTEGFVYQAPAPMPCYEGNWPVFGVWTVGGEAAGLGIREDRHRITTNASRFVPHYFR